MTHNLSPSKELMIPSTNQGPPEITSTIKVSSFNLQNNSKTGLVKSSRTVSSGAS